MAEAAACLEVALAIDAVTADKGAVLPVRPVPALRFTPEMGGMRAGDGASMDPEECWHPSP